MRDACPTLGCRPSCTCILDARTRSRRWRVVRTFRSEQSAIVYAACAPSNHRKTPTRQRYPFGNVTDFRADNQLGVDDCVSPVEGMNNGGPTSELDGRGRKVGVN